MTNSVGIVDLSEVGKVSFDKIVAGDGVKFDIAVTNNSNVDVKYRTKFYALQDTGLKEGLEIVIDGQPLGANAIYSKWVKLTPDDDGATVTVSIVLPDSATSVYADKSCVLSYCVEAIQSNAETSESFVVTRANGDVEGYTDFNAAFRSLQSGDTLDMYDDWTIDDPSGVMTAEADVTLNGNNHLITLDCKMDHQAGVGLKFGADVESGGHLSGHEVINDLRITGSAYTAMILQGGSEISELNNITIDGQYTHSAINFYSDNGGILTNCNISNSLSDDKASYWSVDHQYGLGAISVFANRAVRNKITLDNSRVEMLFVNSSSGENLESYKADIKNNSRVERLVVDQENTIGEVYQIDDTSTINWDLLVTYGFGSTALTVLADRTDSTRNTYVITSVPYLQTLAQIVNSGKSNFAGKTIILAYDLDLAGIAWTPIGNVSKTFNGAFDGQEHVISNLMVETDDCAGLFGWAASATIKNLTVNNADVKGYKSVGVITGGYTVTVDNCHVTGTIKVEGSYKVGGIAGETYGSIKNCSVKGDTDSYIKGVFVSEQDNAEGDNVGGIIGYVNESWNTTKEHTVNCSVEGITISGTRKVGGVAGYLQYYSAIVNCSVKDVTISSTASDQYVADNLSKILMGGIVGEATSVQGGHSQINGCSIENVSINLPVDSLQGWDKDYIGGIRGIAIETITNYVEIIDCVGTAVVTVG